MLITYHDKQILNTLFKVKNIKKIPILFVVISLIFSS